MVKQKNSHQIFVSVALFFLQLFFHCNRDLGPLDFESLYSDAASQNINSKKLAEAYSLARTVNGIKSLLVARNGVIVGEEYYNGHGPDSLHDVRSVTKSVTSILIGIAIDKGFITSVDQPIGDFLYPITETMEAEKRNITIRHLLTMSGGFEWTSFGDWSEYNKWLRAEDQINYILEKSLFNSPGEVFNYNDGASHLLSVIVSEASGMSTLNFAEQFLLTPLGIGPRIWAVDNRGYHKGCVALKLTSRDMVKLGLLYVQNGKYNEIEVVSSGWIESSTQAQISTNSVIPYGSQYGFLWWIDQEYSQKFYYANGYGGQFIFIVPQLNLVVVATCDWHLEEEQTSENWYHIISLIIKQIMPAVR